LLCILDVERVFGCPLRNTGWLVSTHAVQPCPSALLPSTRLRLNTLPLAFQGIFSVTAAAARASSLNIATAFEKNKVFGAGEAH
jgi:hypothetical protein